MEITAFTFIGVFTVAYLLVFKLLPWLEGESR